MNLTRRRTTGWLPQVAAGMLLALVFAAPVRCSAAGSGAPAAVVAGDPWKAAQLIRPAELAGMLADSPFTARRRADSPSGREPAPT